MTNWELWFSRQKSRQEIICAVYGHHNNGKCGNGCILFPVCRKEYDGTYDDFMEAIDKYLGSEAAPTKEAVIINLSAMMKEAEKNGYDGYVNTLTRAIELLKEG